MARLTDTQALDLMAAQLSGREWDGEDIERVAELLERTGRTIAAPDEGEGWNAP